MTARRTLASAASLFLLSLGVVGVAGPAQAAHVSCGQTILVSTVLDSNIGPCGAGIIIGASNITLDLNGFTISGGPAGEDTPGILLDGVSGVTVKNGTVTLFDAGVAIEGGSGNTVTGIRALNNRSNFGDYGDGIVMFRSDSNRIINNQVRNNGPWDGIGVIRGAFNVIDGNQITDNNQSTTNTAGIRLENQNVLNVGNFPSNDNVVTNNLVTNSGTFGIQIFAGGSRNQIKNNQVFNNTLDGITAFAGSNNNVIEGNRIQGNRANGIRIRGAAGSFPGPTGNQILRNVSFGNATFDLRDDQPNCDGNVWRGNQAATFTPPCTMTP